MTRTEFVKAYAKRSGVEARFASLGLLDFEGRTKIALPCACGPGCNGWAMVSADGVGHHLEFNAPDELRAAYRKAIEGQT